MNGTKICYADLFVGAPDPPTMAAPRPVLGEEEPKFPWQFSWG
jgi:hypothetical protein